MPTAIVTGATGILGRAIVNELSANPKEWTHIHALSRSKKPTPSPAVTSSHLDLTAPASDQATELTSQNVRGTHIFFAAYLAQDTEASAADVNGAMLRNFLSALEVSGIGRDVQRIVLVTGAKQYGVHLGPVKSPMEESDPWLEGEGEGWPPNFYYVQQRILREMSEKSRSAGGGGWDWTVTYPNDVLGVAKGNFMNLPLTLALYCLVSRELNGPGGDLEWPGSEFFYTHCFDCLTYAPLHAQFCLWAASAETASNQAFNVVNGDAVTWSSMWPALAKRFGLKVPKDMFQRPAPDPSEMKLMDRSPFDAVLAENAGLSGKTGPGKVEQRIDLVRWSQRKDVKEAWDRVASREGLEKEAFEKATWGFLGFVLGRSYQLVISMSKARQAGWTGYIDTQEALDKCFDGLAEEGVLPKNM